MALTHCPTNVGALFHREASRRGDRYVSSMKNPHLYGLCPPISDRRSGGWPNGTEYQDAYCWNYRDLLHLQEESSKQQSVMVSKFNVKDAPLPPLPRPPAKNPLFKLYESIPPPITDKRYRGARYRVDDPVGVQVKEELTKTKETLDGPVKISVQEDQDNYFTPSYRYRQWIDRPMKEIINEMDANTLYCPLPDAPTQYWDFYNVVRMRRAPKRSAAEPNFQLCSVIPIPMDKNVPDLPPIEGRPHVGKFNNYEITDTPFQGKSSCKYVLQ